MSLLIGLMFKFDFDIFFFTFFSNFFAVLVFRKSYKRNSLIYSGYLTGLFNILLVISIGLYKDIFDIYWYGANFILAFSNGIISSMITLAISPYFETIFKITTHQSLLELANLNHPLLKRLMMSAPGTYQHSIMVANLAEAAAEKINADTIICRVGGYFHDIGKMKRPLFFSENQFSNENPHDNLSPRISKMIIASHTKDGVEMASKYKLPKVLRDIMLEHHGTSLVSFFYSQARHNENESNEISLKESFRYSGPKPKFKESGIVMLADSVEAAVKSLDKPSPSKIENLISTIFKSKIEDNQLSDCPITLQELDHIKFAFLSVFKGIHHNRLNYKDEIDKIVNQHPVKKHTKKNSNDS